MLPLEIKDSLIDAEARLATLHQFVALVSAVLGVSDDDPRLLLAHATRQQEALRTARVGLEMARQYLSDVGRHLPAQLGCEAAVDAVLVDALAQLGACLGEA